MEVNFAASGAMEAARMAASPAAPSALRPGPMAPSGTPSASSADDAELRKTFNSFVGQVFFGQMLASMRKTVGKPAYFHGGQAEEIFQQQLDQILGEKMAEASGEKFSEPMFELFTLGRP